MQFITLDVHQSYAWGTVEDKSGKVLKEGKIPMRHGEVAQWLSDCEPGTDVAVETTRNWYWVVDEIEAAGFTPLLVHARKAKMMSGMINKTDRLDNRSMNQLQRVGTLPTVWIPPSQIRDQRDLPRCRMVLVQERTRLKNRVQVMLAKYGYSVTEVSDTFGKRGREILEERIGRLPSHGEYLTEQMLERLDLIEEQIRQVESRMRDVFRESEDLKRLQTAPGIGFLLSVVILNEVGEISRFSRAQRFASYSGTTPRVHSSGGKTRYGRMRPDVNRYLKWAFVEGANAASRLHRKYPDRHISRLYTRLRKKKNHPKAIGAVARHLAEATYWMLTKGEAYRDPQLNSLRTL